MTPERKAYIAKCSAKELSIRACIEAQKLNIKAHKADFKENPTRASLFLQLAKYKLNAYRHELARLTGMDRVVVPRRAILARWSGIWHGYCKCDGSVKSLEVHCPHCGRRILWEKAEKHPRNLKK